MGLLEMGQHLHADAMVGETCCLQIGFETIEKARQAAGQRPLQMSSRHGLLFAEVAARTIERSAATLRSAHVDVDGELGALEAEHQDAGDGLGADALEPRQLRLDRLVVILPGSNDHGMVGRVVCKPHRLLPRIGAQRLCLLPMTPADLQNPSNSLRVSNF